MHCDIFCKVIDNFGDIGICWRLARQLDADHGWKVQLWVDDLPTFAKLCSAIDPSLSVQNVGTLRVRHWNADAGDHAPIDAIPEIVIEAFGCDLPERYIQRMATCQDQHDSSSNVSNADTAGSPKNTSLGVTRHRPVWINLEYLSGESWVPHFHALPSMHPRYPLIKTCFFPGLEKGTGGVLKERDLLTERETFLNDPAARTAFWEILGLSASTAQTTHTTRISLFCYENPLITTLLDQWSMHPTPIVCFVPQGLILPAVAQYMGQANLPAGTSATKGQLTVYSLPFLTQHQYDQLLWLCDLNFVRGEDSFVRAQWAQRPFIWHIYPQQEQAHLIKLEAALQHYTAHLEKPASEALIQFWHAWNGAPDATLPDPALFWAQQKTLQHHAHSWAHTLSAVGDLSSNLVAFCEAHFL